MNSKQINFFLTPEDIQEVNEYLKENKLLVIPQPIPTENIVLIDSLLTRTIGNEYKIRGQKYIARPEDKDKLLVEHIKEQNYYLIEMMNSPVIEFLYPIHTSNTIQSGRIYFIKDILDESKDMVVMKNTGFLDTAEKFIGSYPYQVGVFR